MTTTPSIRERAVIIDPDCDFSDVSLEVFKKSILIFKEQAAINPEIFKIQPLLEQQTPSVVGVEVTILGGAVVSYLIGKPLRVVLEYNPDLKFPSDVFGVNPEHDPHIYSQQIAIGGSDVDQPMEKLLQDITVYLTQRVIKRDEFRSTFSEAVQAIATKLKNFVSRTNYQRHDRYLRDNRNARVKTEFLEFLATEGFSNQTV